MIKALEENKKIEVNNDKKTVTVRATISAIDFDDWISTEQDNFFNSNARFFVQPMTFVGIARLKLNDSDNVEEATHIAISKMERQYYKYIRNCVNSEIKYLNTQLNNLKEKSTKTENTINRINSHIVNIVGKM